MHGSAEESGAPKGNKKALKKRVLYPRGLLEERRRLRKLMADARKMLKELV